MVDLNEDFFSFQKSKMKLNAGRARPGRKKIHPRDKAKVLSLRLYESHFEILDLLPGKGVSEKVRNCLEEVARLKHREQRALSKISIMISHTASKARELRELNRLELTKMARDRQHGQKLKKAKESFFASYESLQGTIHLFDLDFDALKKGLGPEATHDLNLIYLIKNQI